VFAAGGVSVSRTGPFDVWLSGTTTDGQRRTVKATAAGAVSRTAQRIGSGNWLGGIMAIPNSGDPHQP